MKDKVPYFDWLRAVALIAVVIIHISSPLMNMNWARNEAFWWLGLVWQSSVRFAVAMFVVLTGATLLTKPIEPLQFYKRRFSRVVLPALFWLPAYWVFRWFMLVPAQRPMGVKPVLDWALQLFDREGVSKHLWYLYMIILLYALMPLIAYLLQKLSLRAVLMGLAGWMVVNLAQMAGLFSLDSLPSFVVKIYNYLLYAGYLVTGYVLVRYFQKTNFPKLLSVSIFFTTVFVAAFVTYILSHYHQKQTTTFMSTFCVNTFIQVLAVYFFFKSLSIESKFLCWLLGVLSNYSFGIYLVHIMVISLLFRVGVFWTMAHPLISIPLLLIIVLLISWVVIFILRRLPGLKYVAG